MSGTKRSFPIYALAALLCTGQVAEAVNLQTPFEATGDYALPSSSEISKFYSELAAKSSVASVRWLGKSAGGRPVEALLLSKSAAFHERRALGTDRLTVMLIGSQHGNEPSGAEALQMLARDIAVGPLSSLLDSMNFVFIAMANPDGRDLSSRYNAAKENPNVDYVTLLSGEARLYVDALDAFTPDVVYDAHESGISKSVLSKKQGFYTDVEAQFEVGNNPNIDYALRQFSEEVFLPELIAAVEEKGLAAQRYRGEVTTLEQSVSRGGLGISNLRNYAAMQGALSVLVENRLDGKDQQFETPRNIKERVRKQYVSAQTLLETIDVRHDEILELTRRAKAEWNSGPKGERKIALDVAFAKNDKQPRVDVPLTAVESGESVMQSFVNQDRIVAGSFLSLPKAYVIRSDQDIFADILGAHHIPFERVESERPANITQMQVVSFEAGDTYKKGIRDFIGKMDLKTKSEEITLKRGDLVVPTLGAEGVLAGLMLEPDSANAIYQEGPFRAYLGNGLLPVSRLN
ncbi:hypothetical protein E1162_08790 [Rhodobacteraceae bacterium RKSG542]|uniref:M14 family zinc carboxypeptidase n=1 Tax=Pseudovibrio flavus TaxID=2529854 RepID=UPI0012BCE308|nr:M14 family zinc carboxypeptidase [Pseudovibrio flavus]MTI17337.1 hypothetical protein [Pseudovibrio flavus]